jgi:hypothetical protein
MATVEVGHANCADDHLLGLNHKSVLAEMRLDDKVDYFERTDITALRTVSAMLRA